MSGVWTCVARREVERERGMRDRKDLLRRRTKPGRYFSDCPFIRVAEINERASISARKPDQVANRAAVAQLALFLRTTMRAALGVAARATPPGWHAVRLRLETQRHRGMFLSASARAAAPASGVSSSPSPSRPTLRGVIFDMDGTLTVPNHDFALMYERVGCVTGDILTEIDTWDAKRKARAEAIIHEMEMEALVGMRVMPHASSLGAFLDERNIHRGLVTRNVAASVDHFHENHWGRERLVDDEKDDDETTSTVTPPKTNGGRRMAPFSPALARDFRPYKPAPDALLAVAKAWGVPPSECAMVGDSAKDDVVAGNRAGCVTILLDTKGKWRLEGEEDFGSDSERKDTGKGEDDDNGSKIAPGDDVLRGEMVPTHVVRCLSEIRPLLERHYELVGRENSS